MKPSAVHAETALGSRAPHKPAGPRRHRAPHAPARGRAQRGISLIVALIMLVAMAMLAVWAHNAGTTNLRVVGNSQVRHEALAATQAAVESTISSPMFITHPAAVAAEPVGVDVDGDGREDYSARLSPAPSCYRVRTVKTAELDPAVAADLACFSSGSAQNAGIVLAGATTAGDSLCADSEWNVRATVSDAATGARAVVNQGIGTRSLATDAANACP